MYGLVTTFKKKSWLPYTICNQELCNFKNWSLIDNFCMFFVKKGSSPAPYFPKFSDESLILFLQLSTTYQMNENYFLVIFHKLHWYNESKIASHHHWHAIFVGKQLMLRVAEMVPKHHGRTKKQEAAATSTAGPSNKSGKGGKKRR